MQNNRSTHYSYETLLPNLMLINYSTNMVTLLNNTVQREIFEGLNFQKCGFIFLKVCQAYSVIFTAECWVLDLNFWKFL